MAETTATSSIKLDQKLQFKIFQSGATSGWDSWANTGATGQLGFNEESNKIKVNGIEYGLSPEETTALENAVTTLYNNGLLATGGASVTWLSYPADMATSGTAPISDILNALKSYTDTKVSDLNDLTKTAIHGVTLTGITNTNLLEATGGDHTTVLVGHIDGADIAVGEGGTQTHTYTASSVANAIEDIDERLKNTESGAAITLVDATGHTSAEVKADGTTYTLKQGSNVVGTFNILKDTFVGDAKLEWSTSEDAPDADNTQETKDDDHIYPTLFLDIITHDGTGGTSTSNEDVYMPMSTLFHDVSGVTGATVEVSVTQDKDGNRVSAEVRDYSLATSHLATSAYNELTNDVHSVNISGATVHVGDDTTNYEGSAVTGVVSVTINGATVKTTTQITGATSIASGVSIEGALQAIDTKLKEVEDAKTGSVVDWGTVTGAASHSKSDTSTGVVLNIDIEGTSIAIASGTSASGVAGATSGFETYDSSSSVAQAIDAVNIASRQYADSLITWEVVSNS